MRRTIPIALLLALLALTVAACGGSDSDGGDGGGDRPTVPAGAVAVVGDETITQAQFDELYASAVKQGEASGQPAPEEGSEEETTLRQQVLQSLVQNAEIRQEAASRGIEVDEAKVQEDVDAFKQQCCENKDKRFKSYLEEQGLTLPMLEEQFALRQQAQGLYDEVTKDVTVTPEEAEKQYETDKEARYTTARSRKVAHILIDVKPKGEATDADCERAAEVLAEVQANPGDWKALVKKYSADPGSVDTGGEYEITDDENWDEDFRAGAFGLAAEGDITDPPVKSQFGCHIIKALGPIVAAKTQPFSEVEQAITDELLQIKKNEVATAWFEGVQKDFEPRTAFAEGYSLPPAQTVADTTETAPAE